MAEIKVSKETITPAKAEKYLGKNFHNRNLNEAYAKRLADSFARGEYEFNGVPLVFDYTGTLVDGQHRLRAIILSGAILPMMVVRGVAPKAQETIDIGNKRSMGQVLALRGEVSANNLAATLTKLWQYRNNRSFSRDGATLPSIQQKLKLLEDEPTIRDSVRVASRYAGRFRVTSPAILATLYHLTYAIDAEDCEAFFVGLCDGINLDETSPIYQARRYLRRQKESPTRPDERVVLAILIKAWNAWRDGREVASLSWRAGGRNPEPFPTLH